MYYDGAIETENVGREESVTTKRLDQIDQ